MSEQKFQPTRIAGKGNYTLKRESLVEVAGEVADAALGKFSTANGSALFRVSVEQALLYADPSHGRVT